MEIPNAKNESAAISYQSIICIDNFCYCIYLLRINLLFTSLLRTKGLNYHYHELFINAYIDLSATFEFILKRAKRKRRNTLDLVFFSFLFICVCLTNL